VTFSKIKLYHHTLKHVKFSQVYFRLYYTLRNKLYSRNYTKDLSKELKPLSWLQNLDFKQSYASDKSFTFLNITHQFENEIDWNFNGYGKLWTYNLNYFDFLNQDNITMQEGLLLIQDYIKKAETLEDGLESYPISLRGINWIKFLSKNSIQNEKIDQSLYNHYLRLANNLEYHLLGNHLLENAFSLFFGAYYFQDDIFYKKAYKILKQELQEQVLQDGAHFELSPMYHQIVLSRLLDCIQLLQLNSWKNDDLLTYLESIANKMLAWLSIVTYKNGDIPMVNDATFGIAPCSNEIFLYAENLGLKWGKMILGDSGYRKFSNDHYECFMDLGNIGPDYIPGHAHSDTFNFELYIDEHPFIVDRGISTYEKNQTRELERSTASHNTVEVNSKNQSEVWAGFRVGKRAKIIDRTENANEITASHDGYKNFGVIHQRNFRTESRSLVIEDKISGSPLSSKAFFHLHPSVKNFEIKEGLIFFPEQKIELSFNKDKINIEETTYDYALGFNQTEKATILKVAFEKHLETKIKVLN